MYIDFQCRLLKSTKVFLSHTLRERMNVIALVVLLEAPDTVLIERAAGKRKDPISGGLYPWARFQYVLHMLFIVIPVLS